MPSTIVLRLRFHIRMAGPASSPAGARMLRKRLWRTIQLAPWWTSTPLVYQERAVVVYSMTEYSTAPSFTPPLLKLDLMNCSPASTSRTL